MLVFAQRGLTHRWPQEGEADKGLEPSDTVSRIQHSTGASVSFRAHLSGKLLDPWPSLPAASLKIPQLPFGLVPGLVPASPTVSRSLLVFL